MTSHKDTFEFLTGWDEGVAFQNAKVQELIDSSMGVCDVLTSLDVLKDIQKLIKPEVK